LGLKSGNIALCIQKIKMLKKTGDQMDALELAEKEKTQNIIDMAVGFTAMMPLFQERSADLIKEKLADLFEGLDRISSDQDFSKMHRDFCQWFVKLSGWRRLRNLHHMVMLQRSSILLSRSTFTTARCQVQQRRSP